MHFYTKDVMFYNDDFYNEDANFYNGDAFFVTRM